MEAWASFSIQHKFHVLDHHQWGASCCALGEVISRATAWRTAPAHLCHRWELLLQYDAPPQKPVLHHQVRVKHMLGINIFGLDFNQLFPVFDLVGSLERGRQKAPNSSFSTWQQSVESSPNSRLKSRFWSLIQFWKVKKTRLDSRFFQATVCELQNPVVLICPGTPYGVFCSFW